MFVGEIFSLQMMDQLLANVVNVSCEVFLTTKNFVFSGSTLLALHQTATLRHDELGQVFSFQIKEKRSCQIFIMEPVAFER